MTERIYTEDAYCREFDAVVVSCMENKGRYEIVLDRSCFYPEGGGQPGDRGKLTALSDGKEAEVSDTQENNGEVVHRCSNSFEPGTKVHGVIDWENRFDLMQNHSGEHIVSGLLHKRFGCNNVGFHMGSDCLTVDVDQEISWEDLLDTEYQANRYIWKNVPTQIQVYTHEEARNIEYRSKKEIPGDIRIVTFPGVDVCACCGTHVKQTGEIGLIRILSVMKFHSGVRIEMLCGNRAFLYTQKIAQQNKMISVLLSAKPAQTAEAVSRLKEAAAAAVFHCNEMELKFFTAMSEQYRGKGNVLILTNSYGPDSVRKLTTAVMENCGGICAVFSAAEPYDSKNESEWKYAVGEKNGDVRELVKKINSTFSGRGGGKPFFAQGSCKASADAVKQFVTENGNWETVLSI